MAVQDLVTLAEFKAFLPLVGTAGDSNARLAITRASRLIEGSGDHRYVYRAPPEVAGAANLVAAQTWPAIAGAITAAAAPTAPGHTLIVAWSSATATGTLTATGTVAGVAGVTEVFDAANGLTQHGTKFFSGTVTYAAGGTLAGGGTVSVGGSLGYVEYHTVRAGACALKALERPFLQVLAVNEDAARVYASTTQLVETTDFIISKSTGKLMRVSSAVDAPWASGRRAVKLVYSSGYFGTANVPADLKGIALRLAGLMYQEPEKGRLGVVSEAGAMGSYTRFGAATLSKDLYDELWAGGYVRTQLEPTGERDFDLEAVA